MNIWIIPAIPAALSLAALFRKRWLLHLSAVINLGLLGYAAALARQVATEKIVTGPGGFYLDGLSAIFLVVIALVAAVVGLFAVSYFGRELRRGEISLRRIAEYYYWNNLLLASMFLVVVTENIGILWVAIEATTVTSVLLVGFDQNKAAIEAAWKYILICSVGIILALVGIMLLHFSAASSTGAARISLDWRQLFNAAAGLNKQLVKVSFVFLLIGFGTKAGLAPMHTWLPDAHSQAPTPVSAILSGVLLNCALYGIIRIAVVTGACIGFGFVRQFFTFFGLVSLGVAAPFILIQADLKRLLAYSSVENMGVIAFAFGIGGEWGLTGALLQLVNHALTKAGLFLAAGEVVELFGSKRIHRMRGLFKLSPRLGGIFFAGLLILSGAPPFAIFFSKLTIIYAGLQQGQIVSTGLFLILLTVVFAGLLFHFGKIALGRPPEKKQMGRKLGKDFLVLGLPMAVVLILGFYQPPFWRDLIGEAAKIAGGGLK